MQMIKMQMVCNTAIPNDFNMCFINVYLPSANNVTDIGVLHAILSELDIIITHVLKMNCVATLNHCV